jgi:cytochrome c oxidase subunit 2
VESCKSVKRLRESWLPPVVILAVSWAGGCGERAGAPHPSDGQEELPHHTLNVRMTGQDFKWIIRYPGADGALDTPDDVLTQRHLHLPARTEVTVDLRSADYVYSIFLPQFDLVEAAVPERPFELEFRTGAPGTLELLGSQMCGFSHPDLIGELVIHARGDFDAWLTRSRQ